MKKSYKVVGDFYLSDGVWVTEDIATGFETIDEAEYFVVMNDLVEYQQVRVTEETEDAEE